MIFLNLTTCDQEQTDPKAFKSLPETIATRTSGICGIKIDLSLFWMLFSSSLIMKAIIIVVLSED